MVNKFDTVRMIETGKLASVLEIYDDTTYLVEIVDEEKEETILIPACRKIW